MSTRPKLLEPIHPGEILMEDFMKPMGISINRLARELWVPPGRISAIVNGNRAITADTALRLGKFFGVSPEVWTGLQASHDAQSGRTSTSACANTLLDLQAARRIERAAAAGAFLCGHVR